MSLLATPWLAQAQAAFQVISTVPGAHSPTAPRTAPVTLQFSLPVDPTTVAGITLHTSSKHAINTKGTGGNRVIVTPTGPFAAGEQVSVTIPGTVTAVIGGNSPGGGPRVLARTVQFTAAAGGTTFHRLLGDADGVQTLPSLNDVATGDLNGDGFCDALAASPIGGYVDVLLNAAGSAGQRLLLPAVQKRVSGVPACSALCCVDVNGDGDLDLIVLSATTNNVWLCTNDGTGTFSSPQSIGGGWTTPSACCVGDFDADGDLDLAVANTGANEIVRCTNDAGAFFIDPTTGRTACAGGPVALCCADTDNDGDLDIVASCRDTGEIAILIWQISQWTAVLRVALPAGSNPNGVCAGDMNADGRVDLAVACAGASGGGLNAPSAVRLLRQSSAGAFSVSQTISCCRRSVSVSMADLDGDGDLDLLCPDAAGDAVVVCTNDIAVQGTCSDGSTQDITTGRKRNTVFSWGENVRCVRPCDLDNDGDLDAVTCCVRSGAVTILRNQVPVAVLAVSPAPNALVSRAPTTVSVTYDAPVTTPPALGIRCRVRGRFTSLTSISSPAPEVASWSWGQTNPGAFSGSTKGGLATGRLLPPFQWRIDKRGEPSDGVFAGVGGLPLGLDPGAVACPADLDGDHLIDLVSVSRTQNCCWDVKTSKRTAAAVWASPVTTSDPTVPAGYLPTFVHCADVDGDGFGDVVAVGTDGTNSYCAVYRGDATGSFVKISGESIEGLVTDLALADLNCDGELQILLPITTPTGKGISEKGVSSTKGRRVRATGDFGKLHFAPAGPNAESQLLVCGFGAGPHVKKISVDAAGDLHAPEAPALSLAAPGASITSGDLDGDGLPEAIVPMPTAHAINTKGAGAQDRTFPTGAGSGPTHACTGDVDGDGDLDVVVVCPGNATLWVGLNDGGGTLVGTSLSCPSAPINAWLGDIDDDGRCDLTVHCTDNTVRIFEVGAPASDDLFISTPVTIAPGTYRNVTILEGGVAMTAPGTSITVTGTYKTCASGNHIANANLLGNAARFRVQPGGELHIASPDGIVASGNGGSVPCAGCVPDWLSLAANATYVYDCPTPQVTGTGLPPAVADLLLGNDATQLTLTSPVTVLPAGKMSFHDFNFSPPVRARLISGGKLTLASSAAGTALLDVARIEVVGNLTVQTYLVPKPGGGGYRHFSPPVSTTYGDLATAGLTLVVNPLYNAAPVPGNIRPFPNVFGFDERRSPASGDFLTGYYSPDALISPWPVGRGATVYAPGNITCDFSGLVPAGDVDITGLTRTGAFGGNTEKSGWHMLGNMFPNLLDWDLVTIPAGISGSVSVYESTGGNNGRYLTRTNGLGSLEDGLIAPSQGFFCRVVDPTPPIGGLTLKIKLSDCPPPKENHSKHVTLNKRDAPDLRPRLTLALRDVRAAADEQDVATVYFQAGATAGLDDAFDGARPGRNIGLPTLATLAGPANELAINGLPEIALTQPTTLELLLVLPTAGAHELAVRELAHLTNVSVELLDRLTGARYDLATTARLAFSSALAGEVRGRFALLFNGGRPTGLAADAAPSALVLWPNPAGGAVGVQLAGANPNTAVALLDATGRTVRRAQTDHFGNAALPVGGLVPGIYTVRTGAQTRRLLVD